MRGNGFRKSFCTKGSPKAEFQPKGLVTSATTESEWPGSSLAALCTAVGLYMSFGPQLCQATCLCGLVVQVDSSGQGGPGIEPLIQLQILLAQSFLLARQALAPSFCPETPLFFIV